MCGLGGKRPNGRMPLRGKQLRPLLCLFGVSDPPPPQRKNYFLLRPCFVDEASGEYTGREVWQKLHRGGGASTRWGGEYPPPQTVCDAAASWAQSYAPKGGRSTKRGHEVVVVDLDLI